jgi:hypothetical protein
MKTSIAFFVSILAAASASGAVLWEEAGPVTLTTVQDQAVSQSYNPGFTRGDDATDTLYFMVTINPSTGSGDENYFGGFQLYSGGGERFAVGNNWSAYAWSSFQPDVDFNSATPESGQTYELVAPGVAKTIVYKVEYQSGGADSVTVWLEPVPGLEGDQPADLTTNITADASFDEIRLRLGNKAGLTWEFSNMAIATDFNDLVQVPEPAALSLAALLLGLGLFRRVR